MKQTPQQILKQYEPLANKVARRFKTSKICYEDLVQAARLGIWIGIEKFNPNREKSALTTCLTLYAMNECRELVQNSHIAALKTTKARKISSGILRHMPKARSMGFSEVEAREYVASELEVSVGDVEEVQSLMNPHSGVDELELREDEFDASKDLQEKNRNIILSGALGILSARERLVIERRVATDEKVILEDLASELSLSKESVRRIQRGAEEKMRRYLSEYFSFEDLL